MSGILNSSIGRKFAMALSAFFLMIFLVMHVSINFTSVFSAELFNNMSHFMGTNPVIQGLMQPILIIGVIFHFVMGFVLEAKNRSSRGSGYAKNAASNNSSWMSRNMLLSGLVILAFLGLHFYDFWIHEMTVKYVEGNMSGLIDQNQPELGFRYYEELRAKFVDPWRVIIYVVSFVLLALHLLHGFNSAFQSLGANNKYVRGLKGFGKIYSFGIPALFIFIAVYHHFAN
ncbi:succinate dehydrogenase cytochrome b subunit [Psychroserpens sp.]|uniref:succinate dehydrogenase cytochrome b subunit n=1 Tax=Psychroserpens sp. TaxID=2020870 RepID=UPI001AFFD598|nr:succinate dehydrogenase cytochrome b subunit [Psychroserpens sp.]MBO6605230.1 succinate dehydrogenase cytochrome b subunit [Psychroserpens sp.]MBO6630136.1 succinate dehydrogenase cytochrome b subunit [Psychroserpens sp.]MBO6653961.1 succinate dehydrogenase cytochrome b subunit [Psychroserpens sp.]MBO6682282.1 succinate dehydrogenase cytochrome b subunit [Psychroserpens sp.]MBO6748604.1 succinate dehydrogenase cytochrome b subunit [Psychroserpens sp.]